GLLALEAGVDGNEDPARADDAHGRQHPLVDVGSPDGGPVPWFDAGGHGGPHRAADGLVELDEVEPRVPLDQRLPVAEARSRDLDQPGDRAPLQVAAPLAHGMETPPLGRRIWPVRKLEASDAR